MFDLLATTLSGDAVTEPAGQTETLDWQWRGEGILELSPRQPCQAAVVISAGIHGNETAPVELLNQLVSELLSGERLLRVRLLVLLGNPPSMRINKRFTGADMNRMFGGRHARYTPDNETRRAQELEQVMALFYRSATAAGTTERFHYDLHTAIRGSKHVRFGLLPLQTRAKSAAMLAWLDAAGLDALVHHRSPGGTFTHFSSEVFQADSCTLELGKALPFGSNDHTQFTGIRRALEALVSGELVPAREAAAPLVHYRVVQDVIRSQDDFQLFIPADALNFTAFRQGFVIAKESGKTYRVEAEEEVVLFPNPNVALGLRAGLMLVKM
ncbi:succinylglutamate desuccinylase [Rahnella perminowiae]|uniref:succinylglutamate desuccinylase n=1 Tax=Rahnella perminowiae TaxID=2816244 RepID=UPI00224A9548|nr:succinylglutamate desuccinylase [Rahnella perminowiae]MCX2944708.1 succinylglutamate desuccinylase [Rahnella perminowiae]